MSDGVCASEWGRPGIVGSFGGARDLAETRLEQARAACDLGEIRLDLLADSFGRVARSAWAHLAGLPLLFTARRADEGGAGDLDDAAREALLTGVLDEAAWIDLEVASLTVMGGLVAELHRRKLPWIASFHNFERLPQDETLARAAARAREAGASVFKVAARMNGPEDLARLAAFQVADHGLPVATMGMGPLAPVSRLLCAQCGSVLNYGFLGQSPTAPGQWDAATLGQAIARLEPWRG